MTAIPENKQRKRADDEELAPREEAFCVHYTAIGADTFEHGINSAVAADYSEKSAHVAASRLLKRAKIRRRINELMKAHLEHVGITPEKVLLDLEHTRQMAIRDKQYSVAKGCSELEGRYLGMFADKQSAIEGLNIFIDRPDQEKQQKLTTGRFRELPNN